MNVYGVPPGMWQIAAGPHNFTSKRYGLAAQHSKMKRRELKRRQPLN